VYNDNANAPTRKQLEQQAEAYRLLDGSPFGETTIRFVLRQDPEEYVGVHLGLWLGGGPCGKWSGSMDEWRALCWALSNKD
jgi:hypothetical protein